MNTKSTSYTSTVLRGDQTGRRINFSTINLDPQVLSVDVKPGVYAALIEHDGKTYKGALYFGPRLVMHEAKNVLEIHIFDFDKEIYGDVVTFEIKDYIRGVKDFVSLDEMKEQIENDVKEIKKVLKD